VPRRQARLEPALAGDRAGLLVEQIQRVPGVGDLPADALAVDAAEQGLVYAAAGDGFGGGGDGGPFGLRTLIFGVSDVCRTGVLL